MGLKLRPAPLHGLETTVIATPNDQETVMPRITVGTENDAPIEIHYEDHGSGQPVVLIHGYPLNGNSWERQERELLAAGYRCISYDRRGFGRSSQPTVGYDYDTFAADLSALLEHLDLRDVVLCGFSMGTGEVARYLGTYGSARVSKAALLGCDPAVRAQDRGQPRGRGPRGVRGHQGGDRQRPLRLLQGLPRQLLQRRRPRPRPHQRPGAGRPASHVAVGSSPYASYACVDTWLTDFREDLPKIDVPTLVLHGTDDRILPFAATAARLGDLIADVTVVPVEGGPHNIGWTHPEEVNRALLGFLAGTTAAA